MSPTAGIGGGTIKGRVRAPCNLRPRLAKGNCSPEVAASTSAGRYISIIARPGRSTAMHDGTAQTALTASQDERERELR